MLLDQNSRRKNKARIGRLLGAARGRVPRGVPRDGDGVASQRDTTGREARLRRRLSLRRLPRAAHDAAGPVAARALPAHNARRRLVVLGPPEPRQVARARGAASVRPCRSRRVRGSPRRHRRGARRALPEQQLLFVFFSWRGGGAARDHQPGRFPPGTRRVPARRAARGESRGVGDRGRARPRVRARVARAAPRARGARVRKASRRRAAPARAEPSTRSPAQDARPRSRGAPRPRTPRRRSRARDDQAPAAPRGGLGRRRRRR